MSPHTVKRVQPLVSFYFAHTHTGVRQPRFLQPWLFSLSFKVTYVHCRGLTVGNHDKEIPVSPWGIRVLRWQLALSKPSPCPGVFLRGSRAPPTRPRGWLGKALPCHMRRDRGAESLESGPQAPAEPGPGRACDHWATRSSRGLLGF